MKKNIPAWLPDWSDVSEHSEYARLTKVEITKAQWAWEFLRRNPDYQADFQRLCEIAKKQTLPECYQRGIGFILPLSDVPPTCLSFHADLYRTLTKWGLHYWLPNPNNDLHNMPELNRLFRVGHGLKPAEQYFIDSAEKIPYDGGVIPTGGQYWWLFDINLPLDAQLAEAKRILEDAQRREHGTKVSASKTSPDKYVLYLRLLDAQATGAADNDTGEILYSHISAGWSYSAKSQTNKRINQIGNDKIAAEKLMKGGYRKLF